MNYDLVIFPHYARFLGRKMPVSLGRRGIGEKLQEGDNLTPKGIYQVEEWLYRADRIKARGRGIPRQAQWCDDVNSAHYNQEIYPPLGFGAERLYRSDGLYDLVGVLNYNRNPIVKGRGSAIFLHIWRKPRFPTAGCIAFDPSDLLFINQNWQEKSRVIINT